MKKTLIFIFIFSFLYTEPYKPYPIIFIHGYTSNAGTWGADWDKDNRTDTLKGPGKGTYKFFLDKMTPYCIVWDAIDKTYTKPSDTSIAVQPILYPNKSFLEVFNANYPLGSIDEEAGNIIFPYESQKGWGYEIGERIENVLKEYYGNDWQDNPNAKVVLIAHSMGGPSSRWALVINSSIR
ncbi:MAG: hypothetical protein ABIN20_05740, partial [candidate division WOR-3 bacterium]